MGLRKLKFQFKMPKERGMLKSAGVPSSVKEANKFPKGLRKPKKTLHKKKFF